MLITKTVITSWSNTNKIWYERKGYIFTKMRECLEVDVKDLPISSGVKVEVKCDCPDCKSPILSPMRWVSYKRYIKEDGKYYCRKCASKLYGNENMRKVKLAKGISFEQWCINNNRQDVLDRWDYDLNDKNPNETACSIKKKYYFKCDKHPEHESELKNLNSFTNGLIGAIKCNQCNSFAQWGADNIDEDFLEKYWDYNKNVGIKPWGISHGCHTKVFIICQENSNHLSYKVECKSFCVGNRCPACKQSKGEKRVEKYLVNKGFIKGVDYLSQKPFDGLLGLGGGNLSYDFYLIKHYNLLIEYQGEFHDRPIDFYGEGTNVAEDRFVKQKEHDRRKKEYADDNNIELLLIWYWDFNNIETILNKQLKQNKEMVIYGI